MQTRFTRLQHCYWKCYSTACGFNTTVKKATRSEQEQPLCMSILEFRRGIMTHTVPNLSSCCEINVMLS